MSEQVYRYRAFISYRHVERDRKWARWLIEKLETFRTPRPLVRAGAPLRIGQLFRDDDEIPASSDLSHQIEDALRASQFLIVVCSPDTPQSKWVRHEIEFFRSIGRGNRIFALLVAGEPSEAFPQELLRMPEERTAPDGTKSIEWVDAEPIAADVRPRADERASATERRAFMRIAAGLLGVSFDDLARREQQRRIRQQRVWGSVAAVLALSAGVSSYAYWDFNRVKVRYYEDFGTRWGVPFGIGEVGSGEGRRNAVYAIFEQRGKVIRMQRENGSGGLEKLSGDGIDAEAFYAGAAKWEISYQDDHVGTISLSGPSKLDGPINRLIRTEHYEFVLGGHAAIETFSDEQGNARALAAGASGFAAINNIEEADAQSAITRYRLEFAPDGTVARRLFQKSEYGISAKDSNGSFGRSYTYYPNGQVRRIENLDEHGHILIDKTGIAAVERSYSTLGGLIAIQWKNEKGALTPSPNGCAEIRRQRDQYDNVVREDCLGPDGKRNRRRDHGVASITMQYDEHGNVVEEGYFGTDGKPIARSDTGVARTTRRFDDLGRMTEEHYFGTDNRPALRKDWGVAWFKIRRDFQGNTIEADYMGLGDKPLLRKDTGAARVTLKFDGVAGLIEADYFDAAGKPTVARNTGFARAVFVRDERGEEIEDDFFGTERKLILRKDVGFAKWKATRDGRGNMIEERFLGTDDQPILRKDWGVAGLTRKYDERGNVIEVDYLGTDGKPMPIKPGGFASQSTTYDDRGNVIDLVFLGTDGRPILRTDSGIARITEKHDSRGDDIEDDYFDTGGKPVQRKDAGIARITRIFDSRGNEVEEDYFNTAGKPELSKVGGFARLISRYDEHGNKVEIAFFGVDGRPVLSKERGVAREVAKYDEQGNEIEDDGFGIDGKPAAGSKGVARRVIKYDERGNIVEEVYFGSDGKLTLRRDMGIARVTRKFDSRGNNIEENYFGMDSKPILRKDTGAARVIKKFDALDNVVATQKFGLDGRAIP